MKRAEQWFKYIGIAEGVSFLILMGIAMPVKYLMDVPEAVAVPGMIHGVLFMIYIVALLYMGFEYKWPARKVVMGFLASIVPLGPWIFHKRYM